MGAGQYPLEQLLVPVQDHLDLLTVHMGRPCLRLTL